MLLITGSGRSGTSAVAQLLDAAGLSAGERLIDGDEFNADGYFEERALIELNQEILTAAGLGPWFSMATREQVLYAAGARADAMQALAAEATPVWKDPRFCWTLEAWLAVLPERPRLIVCLRKPEEVIASTLRRYGMLGDEATRAAEHVWRAGYERLVEVIDDYGLEALCVEYSALQGQPATAARALGEFVGRALDPSLIRRELRHHRGGTPSRLRRLYARVRSLGMPATADAADPAARSVRSARSKSVLSRP